MAASLKKVIIEEVGDRNDFLRVLHEHNPGLIIVKFGAKWCGPCKTLKNKFATAMNVFYVTSPDNVLCMDLDVDIDSNMDVYGYLKSARIVSGIPSLLCYKKGSSNLTFSDKGYPIPDANCTGANSDDVDRFFKNCGKLLCGE